MKRLMTMLLAVMLVCSMSVPAFAAQEEKEIDVTVKYVSTVEGEYPAQITGETATVEIDGVTVSVTDAPADAVTLVVVPIPESEKEAWKWIEECLKGKADPVHTFDIYFLNHDGNRIDADGAVVTINCPHCAGVPVVCSLDTDGTVHVLSASAQGKSVAFTTNGSTYYIMAEELPGQNIDPDSPQTGDSTQMWLWWLLLIISAMGIAIVCIEQKKHRAMK